MGYISIIDTPFWSFGFSVPEGFELVEKPDHKKERLQKELQEKKTNLSYLEKRMSTIAREIEEEEKQLLSLGS